MKIKFQCPVCKFSLNRRTDFNVPGRPYITVVNTDNNIVIGDCIDHSTIVYFTNYKFDLLFESGLSAIQDLYYRESIASLATSLERFYEYVIKIISMGFESNLSKNSWKFVSNQSERQLGAFYYLFAKEFKLEPKILSNKMVELRNKVIHKGYFPNEVETYSFLYEVLEIINFNYKIISQTKENEINEYKNIFQNELWESSIDQINEEVKLYEIELKKLKENLSELPRFESRYPLNKPVKKSFKRNIPTFLFLESNFRYRDANEIKEHIKKTEHYGID